MRQDILNKKKKLLIRICTIFFVSILVVVFWIVFFKNGTPMHVEDASEVSGSPQNMRLTLQVNGY